MQVINSCNSEELTTFVKNNIHIDSLVRTDKWTGYCKLKENGYEHYAEKIKNYDTDFKGLHNVISLIKRWILGTFQGSVGAKHFQWYMEEFTFRFNRRFQNIGKKFRRFVELSIVSKPLTYKQIVKKLEVF